MTLQRWCGGRVKAKFGHGSARILKSFTTETQINREENSTRAEATARHSTSELHRFFASLRMTIFVALRGIAKMR